MSWSRPADPGVVIRSADDYVREGAANESDLAQADARVLNVRVSAGATPRRGDLVDLVPDLEHLYLFDAASGASLHRRTVRAGLTRGEVEMMGMRVTLKMPKVGDAADKVLVVTVNAKVRRSCVAKARF